MNSEDVIEQLENVGFNGVLIIFLFGVYKLLVSRNFISKCGWISIDFRSKELRERELDYKHIVRMAEIELEKLKYSNGIIDQDLDLDSDDYHSDQDKSSS